MKLMKITAKNKDHYIDPTKVVHIAPHNGDLFCDVHMAGGSVVERADGSSAAMAKRVQKARNQGDDDE